MAQDSKMPQAPGKVQWRANVREQYSVLARAIMPHKNGGRDWNMGDITEEALLLWLRQPEQKEIIGRYNLLEALRDRGLNTEDFTQTDENDISR